MEISPLSLLFFLKIIHVPLLFTYILVCLSISSKSPTGLYIYKLKWGYIYKLKQGKLIYSLYKVIPFKSLELALHLFRPLSLSIIRIFKFYLWKIWPQLIPRKFIPFRSYIQPFIHDHCWYREMLFIVRSFLYLASVLNFISSSSFWIFRNCFAMML